MSAYQIMSQLLTRIEALLIQHHYWQSHAPAADRLSSSQPFCLDTLQPYEWLQWVLIPRIRRLIEGQLPLPISAMITPYYEMVLPANCPARQALLVLLTEFDQLIASQGNTATPLC